ncbi:KAP family P-loop NTPase fold protein [Sulfuriflexus mobilis]|uniref:KAP family P-loop NTPase fold protein n=1 Tax=Sulfuriflexus mobilis TaxID=1811807 RepID=UPI000F8360F4|nr:P-loop NTPase fold protein [Sulfuriflexus mobilis]
MKIVIPQLLVEESESFQNDLFERQPFGDALLNVVDRSNGELVISIDGQWGEGKTTFVKMWQGHLKNSNISSVYIDAFSNDYIDDPFISISSAITSFVESNELDDQASEEFKDKAKKVGGKLISWTARLGVKAATLGLIKDTEIEELNDIKGDIAKDTSSLVNKFIEERLESHNADIELMSSFRNALSELPSAIPNNENKPLVVIIDELDRCKPTYAVDLIEKVKHLFAVPNIVFVLVMHKQQLEESVKCIYGQNIDANAYLQKFIHIETTIPKRVGTRHTNDLGRYCRRLLELHELETWGDDRNIVDCVESLANHFNVSLRQLEKVFTNIAILYGSSSERHLRLVPIIVFLSILKVINYSIYVRLQNSSVTYEEICKETGLTDEIDADQNEHSEKLKWLMMWIKYSLMPDGEFNSLDEEDRLRDFGQSLWEYGVDRHNLIPIFIQQLNMFRVE